MKVLVFIDHDITCRHFIMSGAMADLVRRADVRFVFPDDGGKRVKLDPATLPLGAPFERLPIDGERQITWRWLLFADQLKLRPGAHEAAIRRLRWTTLGWKAATGLTLAGLPGIASIFRAAMQRRLAARPNRDLPALLAREKPDVLLHPSVLEGVFINDLIAAARERGIPSVVAMNSWDNPSTKRAVVGKPDWLLVWGEQTREHAVRFVGMARDRVVPFGAAQFDIFREPPRVGRAEFAKSLGIDPNRPIVLFAGSNARTDEIATLQAIDLAISDGRLPNVAVIYRPHPWGGGGSGGQRLATTTFRNIAIDPTMRAYIEALGRGDPGITLPDYRDTHDLLASVDAVASPMSTILFEAALHGKAVVVHAPAGEDGKDLLAGGLPMLHFDEFFALPDIAITRSDAELVNELAVLLRPGEMIARAGRLKTAAARFLAPHDAAWRQRIVDFLVEVVSAQGKSATAREVAH